MDKVIRFLYEDILLWEHTIEWVMYSNEAGSKYLKLDGIEYQAFLIKYAIK